MRPRQVRYQAALRPDICCSFNSRLLPILNDIPKPALSRKTTKTGPKPQIIRPSPHQKPFVSLARAVDTLQSLAFLILAPHLRVPFRDLASLGKEFEPSPTIPQILA